MLCLKVWCCVCSFGNVGKREGWMLRIWEGNVDRKVGVRMCRKFVSIMSLMLCVCSVVISV